MLVGNYPTDQLLSKYGLIEYRDLSIAVIKGDLALLDACINKHMHYFISLGLFALIEKLRLITLRNFMHRIYMIVKDTPELQLNGRANLLNLNLVYKPLRA